MYRHNSANHVTEPKSKRTPVRLRHKIEKASAEKQRKQRKLTKNVGTTRTYVIHGQSSHAIFRIHNGGRG